MDFLPVAYKKKVAKAVKSC